MKNPTILKGELSLLRADKSAVIAELRKSSTILKEGHIEINKLDSRREGVRAEILEEQTRLDEINSRVFSVTTELKEVTQDLKNKVNQNEIFSQKNSQEVKLYLGRIKDLKEQEEGVIVEISRLKSLFDKNSAVLNERESDRLTAIRELDRDIQYKTVQLEDVNKDLEIKIDKESKLTKERLKREDKLRLREKNLDARDLASTMMEEDLITMSKDIAILYARLKELYAESGSKVNLDKLILNIK